MVQLLPYAYPRSRYSLALRLGDHVARMGGWRAAVAVVEQQHGARLGLHVDAQVDEARAAALLRTCAHETRGHRHEATLGHRHEAGGARAPARGHARTACPPTSDTRAARTGTAVRYTRAVTMRLPVGIKRGAGGQFGFVWIARILVS